ncbi:esterase/lipase family protein [Ningiella sp. W23]|uniref:esterase/lipase family protein n=1 Tax=Ningiella sp. W23 TaxID=3023715 RepID=UPI0037583935
MSRLLLFCVLLTILCACSHTEYLDIGESPQANIAPDARVVIVQSSGLFDGVSSEELALLCADMPETAYSQFAAKLLCYQSLLSQPSSALFAGGEQAISEFNRLISLAMIAYQTLPAEELAFGDIRINLLNNHFGYETFFLVEQMRSIDPRLPINISGEMGVPVVAYRKNFGVTADKHYPQEGLFHPASISLERVEFADEAIEIDLRLVHTNKEYIRLEQEEYAVRFSPNAAYLVLVENATLDDLRFQGFINPQKVDERMGIFAINPIDRNKTPILMIHGLNSDPLVWRYITHSLLTTPELNERYQILHAFYASGTPPFYNAMRLRRELNHFIDYYNVPTDEQSLVVIGHSMGGIIGNTLVSDSQYALWDAAFTVRPEHINSELKSQIEEVFVFQPMFDYNQIFFIDTPHRGSDTAQSFIGFVSSSLVTLPQNVVSLFSGFVKEVGIDKLTARMLPFLGARTATSIEVLRPDHPLTDALSDLPINGDAFSIIGSNGELACESEFQCMNITDGVVEYTSALHPQSRGRLIVPSRHNSYQHEKTISFIVDILRPTQISGFQSDASLTNNP